MDQALLENTQAFLITTGAVGFLLAVYLFFRETRLYPYHQNELHLIIPAIILIFHFWLFIHAFHVKENIERHAKKLKKKSA